MIIVILLGLKIVHPLCFNSLSYDQNNQEELAAIIRYYNLFLLIYVNGFEI